MLIYIIIIYSLIYIPLVLVASNRATKKMKQLSVPIDFNLLKKYVTVEPIVIKNIEVKWDKLGLLILIGLLLNLAFQYGSWMMALLLLTSLILIDPLDKENPIFMKKSN